MTPVGQGDPFHRGPASRGIDPDDYDGPDDGGPELPVSEQYRDYERFLP